MHRTTATTLAALIGLSFAAGLQASNDPAPISIVPNNALEHDHAPDRVFVRFKDPNAIDNRIMVMDGVGGRIASSSKLVPGLHCIEIDVSVEEALRFLSQQGESLLYAEPVYIVRTMDTTPNDSLYGSLYGMPQINAPQAWDDHQGDQEFRIAIIDTGIDYNHPDLAANMWVNPGEIPGNGVDDDGNNYVDDVYGYDFANNDSDPMDVNGHGTHCAGTVGGVGNNGIGVAGVNWRCRLVATPFIGSNGTGSIDNAIRAVEYCASELIKVSSNSWGGGGFSQALFDVVQAAGNDFGHVFVAAAGNNGSGTASYPGAMTCDNVICVAATDSNENLADFSQYNATQVDLGAPGVDVVSTTPNNNYSSYSGTSMATPHVAGGVALAFSLMGDASAVEVKQLILSTTRAIPSLSGRCVTGGVLDVEAVLDSTFLGPQVTLLSSVPTEIDAGETLPILVRIIPREDVLVGDSVKVRYRTSAGPWAELDMSNNGPGYNWGATLPAMGCDDSPEFYITYEGQTSGQADFPSGGAGDPYRLLVGALVVAYEDYGQVDGNWSVTSSTTDGQWTRGVPVNCGRADPPADDDGSGSCWLTDNSSGDSCNSDVDNGATTLTSGVINLDGIDAPVLSYSRWFHNSFGDNSNTDTLDVEYSLNGVAWNTLEIVGPGGSDVNGGWVRVSWDLQDIIGNATQIQIRFTASDVGTNTQSVVEAGVDNLVVSAVDCDDVVSVPGDANGDGMVDVSDILAVIAAWATSCDGCPEDLDNSGFIDIADLLIVIASW